MLTQYTAYQFAVAVEYPHQDAQVAARRLLHPAIAGQLSDELNALTRTIVMTMLRHYLHPPIQAATKAIVIEKSDREITAGITCQVPIKRIIITLF